jgi:hypothetical protein
MTKCNRDGKKIGFLVFFFKLPKKKKIITEKNAEIYQRKERRCIGDR